LRWWNLKLFSNAQTLNDKLVDLQLANSGAANCKSTDGYRSDSQGANGDCANRQRANSPGYGSSVIPLGSLAFNDMCGFISDISNKDGFDNRVWEVPSQ
jgi:hypothetical protein